MDGELKERLAVLETLLKSLKKSNEDDFKEIKGSIKTLNTHVNEELKDYDNRVKDLELWRASQAPAWSMLKWFATIIGGSFIGGAITCLLMIAFGVGI